MAEEQLRIDSLDYHKRPVPGKISIAPTNALANHPGSDTLCLEHLVADFNGTLAVDGALLSGVANALRSLANRLWASPI